MDVTIHVTIVATPVYNGRRSKNKLGAGRCIVISSIRTGPDIFIGRQWFSYNNPVYERYGLAYLHVILQCPSRTIATVENDWYIKNGFQIRLIG